MIEVDRLGSGVRVAIVDSGVDSTHPFFANAQIEELCVVAKGASFTVEKASTGDASGHGTACAGILHRLAPKATIVSVRALGPDGRGSRDALVAALRFCVREGYGVVNLSLGIDVPKATPLKPTDYRSIIELYEVADDAFAKRVMLVAAGPNVASLRTYPGRAKSLIGVGRGAFADAEHIEVSLTADHEVVAPGVDVVAPALGGGERKWTGTSFACPHVAAHVARIIAFDPNRSASEVRWALYQLASPAPKPEGQGGGSRSTIPEPEGRGAVEQPPGGER